MGTSASYAGPNWPGTNEAINHAIQDGSIVSPGAVGNAVAAFSRDYLSASRGSGSPRGSSGASSGGGGGAKGGTGGASATAKAGAGFARFISTVRSSGLDSALTEIDLASVQGGSVQDICDAIADALVDQNGLLDDASIREAMSRTMEDLCAGAITAEELEKTLQDDKQSVVDIVIKFYTNALQVNFENKEWNRVQERLGSADKARDFFQQSKDYIQGFVEYNLARDVDLTKYDLSGPDGIRMADELNQEVLEALGNHE